MNAGALAADPALGAVLRRLAVEAGAAIMAVRAEAEAGGDLGLAAKTDDSPVTRADLAADRILCAGLAAAFPGLPVVTEERPETHALGAGAAHFLVDPLDGTKEFLRRDGEFTVNVALVAGGRPVAGVVYAPATGRLFLADAAGAREERVAPGAPRPTSGTTSGRPEQGPEQGPTRALRVAEADPDALRVVASKSHRDAATDAWIAAYPVASFVAAGSSLKFCLVAAGEADLYPRLGPTMEWDTAAGQAVLEAAGGRVLRLDDRAPLTYGGPERRNPFFVALGAGVTLR